MIEFKFANIFFARCRRWLIMQKILFGPKFKVFDNETLINKLNDRFRHNFISSEIFQSILYKSTKTLFLVSEITFFYKNYTTE